ncbi:MAG: hypothetical protein KBT88_00405 [Gammaproteobacteria bacterium]|nr:hypothetical protein [Gammaproteobacteria bacterium]MBQ0838214.1 hypothetical protein [Gammaproteobacteria bacterium]
MALLQRMYRTAQCCLLLMALGGAANTLATPPVALAKLLEQSTQVTTPRASKALLVQIQQSLAVDLESLTTQDFVSAADAYGHLVAGAREESGGKADFEHLISRGASFYQRCRAKIRNLEEATGDREAALETLYRSDIWHDINYALSAFNYWQAWGKLGLAHNYRGEQEQVKWLNEAEHGFQTSSVRILYPGIVYGSWLGMAYVAQARGDEGLAEQRFRRLVMALAGDEDNPVRTAAETELTLLAIRKGELPTLPPMADEPLTPSTARVYQEQAFMLLQRQRDTQTGALEAAVRLKRVIEMGFLNDALLNRIIAYRDEIAGRDIGLLSLYVDTEYAFAWHQYDTTVLKYRAFVEQGGLDLPVNLRVLQYHYAVALLEIQLAREALKVVENLQHETDLPQPVAKALPKLKFLIAMDLYQRRDNSANRKRVLAEAEYFLRLSPSDGDVGSAHLLIGQLSADPDKASRHMKAASKDKKLKGSVAMSQMQRAIGDFNRAVIKVDARAQQKQAKKVLAALAELRRNQRKKPWFRAVSLQMRAVLAEDLERVLRDINEMYADAEAYPDKEEYRLDQRVRRVLMWAELRARDSYQQGQTLAVFIGELAHAPSDAMVQKEVYQFLLAKEQQGGYAQIVALAEAFYPALQGQPQDQRQLRLLQIRAANALGEGQRAYQIAEQLIADFADSGDAWVAFAQSAEQMERWFEAERAWAKITVGQPQGSPRWREAMFKRSAALTAQSAAETEGDSGQKEDATDPAQCSLLARLSVYRRLMAAAQQRELDKGIKQQSCTSIKNARK